MALEGFSIREYVSNMRSVDVKKCWPFGAFEEYEIESSLPPITIRKYRWWASELDDENMISLDRTVEKSPDLIKDDKAVMICPVCRNFSASTVNAVNAHIDSCLAQASKEERRQIRIAAGNKAKARPAKKRSIAEIFATAPQIETAGSDCVEDNGSENKRKANKKIKSRSKSKKDAMAIVRKLKLKIKKEKKNKNKNKMKKKKIVIDGSSLKRLQEKFRTKPLALDHSAKLRSPVCNKKLKKKNSDTILLQKRKVPRRNNLPMDNQLKAILASKFLTKHHRQELPPYPIQSILKNQKRVSSYQKSSSVDNTHNEDHAISRNVPHLNKHVRFSEKDDILGPGNKRSSSIVLTKPKDVCQAFSGTVDGSTGDHLMNLKTNGSRQHSGRSVGNEIRAQSTSPNVEFDNFYGQVSTPPFLNPNPWSLPDKEKCFLDGSLNVTQAFPRPESCSWFNQDSSPHFQRPRADINGYLQHSRKERYNPMVEIDRGATESVNGMSSSVPDHLFVPISGSDALDSQTNMYKTSRYLATQSSANRETNRRISHPTHATVQNSNGCSIEFQPLHHMSTKNRMSNMVEWKKQKTNISQEQYIYDDFIGLPLNSLGELISYENFGQMRKENTLDPSNRCFSVKNLFGPGSCTNYPSLKEGHYSESAVSEDKLRSFSEHSFFKDVPEGLLPYDKLHVTGRTGFWPDRPRESSKSICQLGLDLNMMSISACEYGKSNPSESDNENIQRGKSLETCMLPGKVSTMRLMGKDVAVGRVAAPNSSDDGKIWTDKEIITVQRSNMISDNSSVKRHFQAELLVNPITGKGKETVSGPSLVPQIPCYSQMNYADNRFAHPHLKWQTMPQNGAPWTCNSSVNMQPLSGLPASWELVNRTIDFPGTWVPQADSVSMRSRMALPLSSCNSYQPQLLNSAQFGSDQSLVYGTSALKFPFEAHDFKDYFQVPQSKCSSQGLPHWMLNSTIRNEYPLGSQIYISEENSYLRPCGVYDTNSFPVLSPQCNALISNHPANMNVRFPNVQNSIRATSSAQRPLIPVLPGYKPGISVSANYRKVSKVKEKSKPKHFLLRDTALVKRDRKRPADKLDGSAECLKKPNLVIEVESSSDEFNQCTSDSHAKFGAEEFDVKRDEERGLEHSPIETEKDRFRTSTSGFSICNMDQTTRSGPIKLSAGAKHILKPSEKCDQDNCRPIHSTIPFGSVSNSHKVTEIPQKSAKVYWL